MFKNSRTHLPRRLLPRRLLQAHFQGVPEPRFRLRAAPGFGFGPRRHFAAGELPAAGLGAAGGDVRQREAGDGRFFNSKEEEGKKMKEKGKEK